MNLPVVIRKASQDDTHLLSQMIRTSFQGVAGRFGLTPENCPKHPSNYTDQWIGNDFDRGVTYFILEDNGIAKGCAAIERAGPSLCYLERLAVLPEYRRCGFGNSLVAHIFSQARAHGAEKIGIGIIADDLALKKWYQKIGFVEGETKSFSHLPFRVTFMNHTL